jgi:serine phosphatase RsbU (regulator of sigma subunit)
MHSSQYPDHPARHLAADAPSSGALEDLIAQTRRLREGVDTVRRDEPEDGADQRVRRAVWNLAAHQLEDFAEQLEQLDRTTPRGRPDGRAQLGGRIGSAEWSLLTDGVVWSEELFLIFGRPLEEGPLTLDQLPSFLVAEDQPRLTAAVTRCLVDGRSVDCEFRIVRPDGRHRTVQLAGEPILDDLGSTVAMWAIVRDVSELRDGPREQGERSEPVPRLSREQQRMARSEHRLAIALQESALTPWLSPPERAARPGVPRSLELAACYVPAASGVPMEGKWHDWLELPDGSSVLSVGDLSGRGPAAAAGTATTVGALRGIALTGASPGRALEHLNELLDCGSHPVLASLVCCHYRPEDGSLVWAQAGHPAPLLCRDGAGRILERPAGTLLGAIAGTVYEERTDLLESGDTLVLHTDGLFPAGPGNGRGTDPRLLTLAPRLATASSARDALRLVLRECEAGHGGADDGERPEDACLLVARVS